MLLFISLSYVIVTAAWITTENRSLLPVMELLTIWSAVAVLLFMIEIHRGAVDAHRSGSLAALLLTADGQHRADETLESTVRRP